MVLFIVALVIYIALTAVELATLLGIVILFYISKYIYKRIRRNA